MSDPTNLTRDLTGKNIRCWFVVAYAGQRDGVHYWRCMCRASLAEKVVVEWEILDPKLNVVSRVPHHWVEACENPIGWIYGEWTVIGPASEHGREPPGEREPLWKCRCSCGTERDLPRSALIPPGPRSPSCGCCPDEVLRAELQVKRQQARKGWNEACGAGGRRDRESRLDNKWTQDMQSALCRFQPACVNCGTTDDLTTHHLRPLSGGHGLEPGNAVRLCRACNSFIYDRDPGKLSSGQARKLETAAAQFKEFWESGCTTPEAPTAVPAEETPKTPDAALIALLRAVERGDDAAIPALANWLEERGDPRASAIRDVARVEAIVKETRTRANEVSSWVEFLLDGKRCGPSASVTRSSGDTEDSLAQRIQEAQRRLQSDEVWQRLGLKWDLLRTLKQYFGINPMGLAATIEEIAQREGKRVQTIRNRIDLALHRLTVPSPHERR